MQAAPGPLLGTRAETRANGVVEDVVDHRSQVLVAVDDPRGVPIAEEVAPAFVAPVERQRMRAVEAVHAARHGVDRGLEHEVVVRRHQAVRVEIPAEALDAVPEELQETRAIESVPEDRALVHAERRDVEDAVRQDGAKDSRHRRSVRCRRRPLNPRGRQDTLSLRRTRPFPPTPRVRPKAPTEVAASFSAGP